MKRLKLLIFGILMLTMSASALAVSPIFWNKLDYNKALVKGGLGLDGSSYVDIPSTSSNEFGMGDYAISLWFKRGSGFEQESLFTRVHSWDTSSFQLIIYNDQIYWQGTSDSVNTVSTVTDTTDWHNIIVLRNGSSNNASLYLDGVFEASGDYDNLTNTTDYMDVGESCEFGCGATYPFIGEIDELEIYNRTLTTGEITDIYNRGLVGLPSNVTGNVLGYWNFDMNASDSSGNGNDGILQINAVVGAGDKSISEIGVNGTITGTPTYDTGKFGYGVNYSDSSNKSRWEHAVSASQFNNPMTVEFWWKPQYDSNETGQRGIFYMGQAGGNYPYYIFAYNWVGTYKFMLGIADNSDGSGQSAYRWNGSFSANTTWYHIALVTNQNETAKNRLKLYIDGVQQEFDSYMTCCAWQWDDPWNAVESLDIFTDPEAWAVPNYNTIDNLKIYDYAKTDFSDRFIEGIPEYAIYSTFTGTDFNNMPYITNIANAHISKSSSTVQWNNNINVAGADFDSNTAFGSGFVSINTSKFDSSLNSSVNVTLYTQSCNGLTIYHTDGYYTTLADIITNGQLCEAPLCTNIQCVQGGTYATVTVTVAHLDGLGGGSGAVPEFSAITTIMALAIVLSGFFIMRNRR